MLGTFYHISKTLQSGTVDESGTSRASISIYREVPIHWLWAGEKFLEKKLEGGIYLPTWTADLFQSIKESMKRSGWKTSVELRTSGRLFWRKTAYIIHSEKRV